MAREKIGELVVELRAETKQLRKELNLMKKRMQGVKKETDKATKGISNFVSTIGITAGVGTALFAVKNFTMEAVKLGFEMEGLESAFNNMAGQSAPELIRQLDKAAAGTVANIDLIAASNRAMLLGIDKEALPEMMEIARAAAQAMGTDVTTAFNDIAKGLGRQSKLILDNLGIIVSIETANKNYAEQLGKSASALTDAEMKQAFLNETLKAGRENIENMGGALDTNKEAVQRLTAQWKEFKTSVGSSIAEGTGELAKGVTTLQDMNTEFATFIGNIQQVTGVTDKQNQVQAVATENNNDLFDGITQLLEPYKEFIEQIDSTAQSQRDQRTETEGLISSKFNDLEATNMLITVEKKAMGLTDDFTKSETKLNNSIFQTTLLVGDLAAAEGTLAAETQKAANATSILNIQLERQKALVSSFGSAKRFESVRRDIESGDVEATEGVKGLFGIGNKQMGGLVQRDSLQFLHQGEQVVPKGQVNGRGGSGGITVNIGTISGLDADAIAEALQEKLTKLITV